MQSDIEFLGLRGAEDRPGEFSFDVVDRLARMDGRLYGGTALAVSIAAAELLSSRSAVWMTTQFVASAGHDTTIDVLAEVLAPGRRTNQVRVTGTDPEGHVVFASLGAAGVPRTDGPTGEFENGPRVTDPEESARWTSPFSGLSKDPAIAVDVSTATRGFTTVVEVRHPEIVAHPDPGPGRLCLWVRRRDGQPFTRVVAAYVADLVPMGIAHALGELVGGTSLDNTIRLGGFVDTEWLLLDLRPHLAAGGYGHGVAHLWSEDGRLLATASQTASMFRIDPTNLPWTRDSV